MTAREDAMRAATDNVASLLLNGDTSPYRLIDRAIGGAIRSKHLIPADDREGLTAALLKLIGRSGFLHVASVDLTVIEPSEPFEW